MTLPASYFITILSVIRPVLSSGLLVGIILALLLENLFNWDKYGNEQKDTQKAVVSAITDKND